MPRGIGGPGFHPFPSVSNSVKITLTKLVPQRSKMRFDTVIRNGTVVTAIDTCLADVGINGEKVTAIASQLPTENAGRVLDATGMLVIPGGIDVHTRSEEHTSELQSLTNLVCRHLLGNKKQNQEAG